MSSRQSKKLKDPQRHAASKVEEIEKKSLAIDLHFND
jgi:hypothetical protein